MLVNGKLLSRQRVDRLRVIRSAKLARRASARRVRRARDHHGTGLGFVLAHPIQQPLHSSPGLLVVCPFRQRNMSPKRVYDNYGGVTLSSQVPSSGAGIATLNPIAEVPAGDVDLIAGVQQLSQ